MRFHAQDMCSRHYLYATMVIFGSIMLVARIYLCTSATSSSGYRIMNVYEHALSTADMFTDASEGDSPILSPVPRKGVFGVCLRAQPKNTLASLATDLDALDGVHATT